MENSINALMEGRQLLISLYAKYGTYVRYFCRFVVVFLDVFILQKQVGFGETLSGILPALGLGLAGMVLPANLMIAILGLLVVLQAYTLSLEAALMALVLFVLMALLYLRFSPRDSWLILLTPVFAVCRSIFLLPVLAGLLFTPLSVIGVSCSMVYLYFVRFLRDNAKALRASQEGGELVVNLRFVIDGLVKNRDLMVVLAAFALALAVVYFLRKRRHPNAWDIAILAGVIVALGALIVGDIALRTNLKVPVAVLGAVITLIVAMAVRFFIWNLDFRAAEDTQFEDDDYYYYVKAVPKVTYAAPMRQVRKINTSRRARTFASEEALAEEAESEILREEAIAEEELFAGEALAGEPEAFREEDFAYEAGGFTEQISLPEEPLKSLRKGRLKNRRKRAGKKKG